MNLAIQIVIGGLLQGAVFAVIALGFSLVFRVTGVINLSQGAFCVLGALLMYTFQVALGWPVLAAALAASLGTGLFGLALGAATFVPALPRLPPSSMLVMTAGLLTLIEGLLLVFWSSQPYALPPFSGEAPVLIGEIRVPTQGFWIAGIAASIIVALWLLIQRTTLGMALQGLRREPHGGAAHGHRRAAHDAPQLRSGRAHRRHQRHRRGADHLARIRHRPLLHQFRVHFRRHRRHGLLSRLGVRRPLPRAWPSKWRRAIVSSLFANALALALLLAVLLWRPNGLFPVGPARRTDVRDEQRVYRAILRHRGQGRPGLRRSRPWPCCWRCPGSCPAAAS